MAAIPSSGVMSGGGGRPGDPIVPAEGDHPHMKEQLNRVVTKYAPQEPEEEYVLEYETEGHTPEVAKCLANAYKAGENAVAQQHHIQRAQQPPISFSIFSEPPGPLSLRHTQHPPRQTNGSPGDFYKRINNARQTTPSHPANSKSRAAREQYILRGNALRDRGGWFAF